MTIALLSQLNGTIDFLVLHGRKPRSKQPPRHYAHPNGPSGRGWWALSLHHAGPACRPKPPGQPPAPKFHFQKFSQIAPALARGEVIPLPTGGLLDQFHVLLGCVPASELVLGALGYRFFIPNKPGRRLSSR